MLRNDESGFGFDFRESDRAESSPLSGKSKSSDAAEEVEMGGRFFIHSEIPLEKRRAQIRLQPRALIAKR